MERYIVGCLSGHAPVRPRGNRSSLALMLQSRRGVCIYDAHTSSRSITLDAHVGEDTGWGGL